MDRNFNTLEMRDKRQTEADKLAEIFGELEEIDLGALQHEEDILRYNLAA